MPCGQWELMKLLLKYHSSGYMMNESLKVGLFPGKWKIAKLSLLYTDSDCTIMEKYFWISALPLILTILERPHHDQLYHYLQDVIIYAPRNLLLNYPGNAFNAAYCCWHYWSYSNEHMNMNAGHWCNKYWFIKGIWHGWLQD